MKKGFWLFVLGLTILMIGIIAGILAIVFELTGKSNLASIMSMLVVIAGPVSIILLLIKLMAYGGAESPEPKKHFVNPNNSSKKDVTTVEVKQIKKSQDEIMYDKYVDLYNQKLITKEDLEKKRKELLGK